MKMFLNLMFKNYETNNDYTTHYKGMPDGQSVPTVSRHNNAHSIIIIAIQVLCIDSLIQL